MAVSSKAIQTTPGKLAALLRQRDNAARKAVQRAVLRGGARGLGVLRRASPSDLGQLRSSWELKRTGAKIAGVSAAFDREATLLVIQNNAPHAGIVEHGARPHPVSREGWEAIYWWVYRHRDYFGMVTKSGKKKRVDAGGWKTYGRGGGEVWEQHPELASITYGIVKRLREEGQKPTYFVQKLLPHLQDYVAIEFVRLLKKLATAKSPEGK